MSDFRRLAADPLWAWFWSASDLVVGKRLELRRQLENTNVSDPHVLGKLRGQLELLEQIPQLVEARAEIERKKEEAGVLGDVPVRAGERRWPSWVPRIR